MNAAYINQQIKQLREKIKSTKFTINEYKKNITGLKNKIKSENKKLDTAARKTTTVNSSISSFQKLLQNQIGERGALERSVDVMSNKIIRLQESKKALSKRR